MTAAASQRLYPVVPAEGDDDPRFTFGLIFDVALVIEDYGYPPIRSGLDLVDLELALFRFLYSPRE